MHQRPEPTTGQQASLPELPPDQYAYNASYQTSSLGPQATQSAQRSRPLSLSERSIQSARSAVSSLRTSGSSVFLDEIKHEVMVNYLFQQQCARLWISDGSGETEGVLLRKARGQYIACPPTLQDSSLAYACAALNVPVSCENPTTEVIFIQDWNDERLTRE